MNINHFSENNFVKYKNICLPYLNNLRKCKLPNFKKTHDMCTIFIDNRSSNFIEFIIRMTILKLGENISHYIVCTKDNWEYMLKLCNNISSNINLIKLNDGIEIDSQLKYYRLLTNKHFWSLFKSKKCLIYQSATYIFNENLFKNYICYDYIGAPFHINYYNKRELIVGNGGLSIRNIELMKILCEYDKSWLKKIYKNEAEDLFFSILLSSISFTGIPKFPDKNKYNFPDIRTAMEFSIENFMYTKQNKSFGGHQFWLTLNNWEEEIKNNIETTLNKYVPESTVNINSSNNKTQIRDDVNKTIYMTYKKSIPDFVFSRWNNLNSDYKIDFSLDKDCIAFLLKNFNEDVTNLFSSIKEGMYKADLWRLCKLYINGGVYADIDLVPYLNIDTLDKDVTFYTCLSALGNSCFQAFIVNFSETKNPLIFACLLSFLINKPYNCDLGPTIDMYNLLKYNLNVNKIEPDIKYIINTIKIPIKIGPSNTNTKGMNLLYFPNEIKYRIDIKGKKFKDTFRFNIDNNKLHVQRTDSNTGWGQDLSINICIDSEQVIYFFPEILGHNNDWKTSYINYKNTKIFESRDPKYQRGGLGFDKLKINDNLLLETIQVVSRYGGQ